MASAPRQRHALALAARELRRVAVAQMGQAHELEELVDPRLDLRFGAAPDLETERHVATHGQVAERRVVLEAEPDAAAAGRGPREILALDPDGAGVGRIEPGDDAQQRRLPPAARAEQCCQRTRLDLERDVVERDGVTETLRNALDVDAHTIAFVCHSARRRSVTVSIVSTKSAARHRATAPM